MAKKVKPEIRSALPPVQKREINNAIQSEQLLILKKVRYLDGSDDNLSIPTEGSDLSDRSGPISPDDDEASERTDGPDPADLVGSVPLKPILMEEVAMSKDSEPTGALIHYKKDGFLAMANAGRIFPELHYSNKGYIPVSFHEFKQHAKCCVYTLAFKMAVIHSTLIRKRAQETYGASWMSFCLPLVEDLMPEQTAVFPEEGVLCHLNSSPWDVIPTPQDQLSNFDQEAENAVNKVVDNSTIVKSGGVDSGMRKKKEKIKTESYSGKPQKKIFIEKEKPETIDFIVRRVCKNDFYYYDEDEDEDEEEEEEERVGRKNRKKRVM